MTNLIPVALAVLITVVAVLIWSREAIPQRSSDQETSLAAWDRVVTVLQHPRCSNCHQPNEPLQGESGRRHSPRVVRGRDNLGIPGMRCGSCHSEQGNNEASRVPGATDWKMPPRSMSWARLSIGQLCRSLKDPTKNGRRSLKGIIKHMQDELARALVLGPGRNARVRPDAASCVRGVRRRMGAVGSALSKLDLASVADHFTGDLQ